MASQTRHMANHKIRLSAKVSHRAVDNAHVIGQHQMRCRSTCQPACILAENSNTASVENSVFAVRVYMEALHRQSGTP